jgi:hypothetical protein
LVAEPAEACEANLTIPRWCVFTTRLELILSRIAERKKFCGLWPPSGSEPLDGNTASEASGNLPFLEILAKVSSTGII